MTPITNLYARLCYPIGQTNLPIVIWQHSYSSSATVFTPTDLQRLANYGLFVVAVGLRSKDEASGSQDDSGREIYDIYDALAYVRSNYASIVSSTIAAIAGYSGGGGNALAAACKFPDTWCAVIDHFGMSDYGYDATDGWYNNGATGTQQTTMQAAIGGTPVAVPNNYLARQSSVAIANYSGGHLYLFHDADDASVPVVNTDNVKTTMDAASLTNYTYNVTSALDSPRWLHQLPTGSAQCIQTEAIWAQAIADGDHAAWTIAASGTITVIGYIVTKRFSIWLGNGTAQAATVVYDTAAGTYTVTPLTTGNIDVSIVQGALVASQTISSETTLTVG